MTRERAEKVLKSLDAWLASPGRTDVREALVTALMGLDETSGKRLMEPVEEVLARVAAAFGVQIADIMNGHRGKYSVQPRHVVMLLLKEQEMSYSGIARLLGKDHTSVMSGIKSIQRAMNSNPRLLATVNALRAETPRSIQSSRTQDGPEVERLIGPRPDSVHVP